MAGRVNTKFVVLLTSGLVFAAVGVALLGLFALKKSSLDHVKRGDEFAAQGEWDKAAESYSAAVNKEQTKIEWLRKWKDALLKVRPKSQQLYGDMYKSQYMVACYGIAQVDTASYESQKQLLDEIYEQVTSGGADLKSWEHMESAAEEALNRFTGDETSKKKIQRYRGIARAQIVSIKATRSEEDINAARQDLEAALQAHPSDTEAIISLTSLDMQATQRARDAQEGAKADEIFRSAYKRLEEFAKTNAPSPMATVRLYQMQYAEAGRTAPIGSTVRDVMEGLKDQALATVESFEQAPAEKIDGRLLFVIGATGVEALPDVADRLRAEAERIAAAQPNNSPYLIAYGSYMMDRGKYEQAIEIFNRVVNLPTPPLSLAGLRLYSDRLAALSGQSEAAFLAWSQENSAEQKQIYAKQLEESRMELIKLAGEQFDRLVAIDARLKFIQGDYSGARVAITRYNDLSGRRDINSLLLEAQIMQRLGNLGLAEDALKRIIEINPRDLRTLRVLAEMMSAQTRYPEALAYAKSASELNPTDPAMKELVTTLDGIVSGKDPVMAELTKAQNAARGVGADLKKAIEITEAADKKYGPDDRIAIVLVTLYTNAGDKDSALRIVDRELSRNPDDARFKAFRKNLTTERTTESMLADIDNSSLTPVQKAVEKYQLFSNAGEKDKAQEMLTEAARLGPDDPQVVDILFIQAINNKDSTEIDRLVKLAEDKNIDNLGGLTYRAKRSVNEVENIRSQIMEKQQAGSGVDQDLVKKMEQTLLDSKADLVQATNRDKSNLTAWRLLGSVYFQLGDLEAARNAFEEAVKIRPTDISSILGYIRTLGALNQLTKALEFARSKEAIAAGNEDFRALWLTLESGAPGGNRQRAIEYRKSVLASEPKNTRNLIALAQLQGHQKLWDESLQTIEKIREAGLDFEASMLEAEVHLRRGEIDAAGHTIERFVINLPEDKRTTAQYVTAARLMKSFNLVPAAMQLYTLGRPYQDKSYREIDREMADTYYNAGNIKEALGIYKDLMESGTTDEGDLLLARILEGSMALGNLDESQRILDKAGDRVSRSATLLVLSGKLAAMRKDTAKARQMLDQAVRLEPKNPRVFAARAELSMVDESTRRDAEEDFKEALRLAPAFTAARVRLVSLLINRGDFDGAISMVREGVAADPNDDQMRADLANMLTSVDRLDEAAAVIEDGVKAKPDDVSVLLRSAQFMARAKKMPRALELAKQAYETQGSMTTAEFYVQLLLAQSKPDTQTALKVAMSPGEDLAKSVPGLLLRAQVYLADKKADLAYADVKAAGDLLDNNSPQAINLFFNRLPILYPILKDRSAIVDRLEAAKSPTGFLKVFIEETRLADPARANKAIADLQAFTETTAEKEAKYLALTLIGQWMYSQRMYQQAIGLYRQQLEMEPDEPGANNNMAYTLGIDLGRVDEALPYAERAVKAARGNASILDTLGALYIEKGRLDDADRVLTEANANARTVAEQYVVMLHTAILKAKLGLKSQARQIFENLKTIESSNPSFASQNAATRERLESMLKQ